MQSCEESYSIVTWCQMCNKFINIEDEFGRLCIRCYAKENKYGELP